MTPRPKPVRLPTEEEIRRRLTELAIEANTLRSVLRVMRRRNRTRSAGAGVANRETTRAG
jgi:hypothetical protein